MFEIRRCWLFLIAVWETNCCGVSFSCFETVMFEALKLLFIPFQTKQADPAERIENSVGFGQNYGSQNKLKFCQLNIRLIMFGNFTKGLFLEI